MGNIIQLNDQLANKIAAGEVVERPASVVKELVENAIDANSTRIEIHVEEAGLSKIQVIDNGDGIEEEDCLMAFERHATSKIKDENELFRIRTLGFRGEALPSIASVSEVELKTSTGDGPGTTIKLKGGRVVERESANSRKGTEMTVSNLFFNTPARLKHMKTIHTELGNISDVVNRVSLAHPDVSIRLLHNGKKLLHTNGNGDVLQVLAAIYGMSVAKQMIPVKMQSIDFMISGFIAKPEVTRASRNYMSTMINGRFIKNYPLTKAIQQGYHTLLPIGRYPICLINIQMDPLLVDVNVHPAKLEVRLSKEQELIQLVEEGIKNAFQKIELIPEINYKSKREQVVEDQQTFQFNHVVSKENIRSAPLVKEKQHPVSFESEHIDLEKDDQRDDQPFGVQNTDIDQNSDFGLSHEKKENQKVAEVHHEVTEEHYPNENVVSEESEDRNERIPPLYPIGQLHGTYILCQNDKGLYILDQHAAQERVKYEFFRDKVGEIRPEVQELLIPLTFEFSQSECMIIDQYVTELQDVGVFLESFGPQAYIVRSHPQWFPKGYEAEIIEEIIQQVVNERKIDIKALREEAAIMMSCKGSIKANQHLRNDEIFALIESLRTSSDPFTCPHGRPIIIHLSTYEIEKLFKRVM